MSAVVRDAGVIQEATIFRGIGSVTEMDWCARACEGMKDEIAWVQRSRRTREHGGIERV